jgi:hypothetical protein
MTRPHRTGQHMMTCGFNRNDVLCRKNYQHARTLHGITGTLMVAFTARSRSVRLGSHGDRRLHNAGMRGAL